MRNKQTVHQLQRWVFTVGVVSLLLTACGVQPKKPAPEAADVEINLTGGTLLHEGVRSLLPAEIMIFKATTGTDDDGPADRVDEPVTVLDVAAGTDSVSTTLQQGHSYDVFIRVRGPDDPLAAIGTDSFKISDNNHDVARTVRLKSVLGSARLTPRLPVQRITPGQEVDLLLSVLPNAGPDHVLPLTDFDVTYSGTGELTNESHRGIRVTAGERTEGGLRVTADVAGLIPTAPRYEWAHESVITATFERPFLTGVNVDVSPPDVRALALDSGRGVLTGVVVDDHAVARVDVFDGPVLLASTASSGSTSPEIVFPDGGAAFVTHLAVPVTAQELQVIAVDYSGNQTTATLEVENN